MPIRSEIQGSESLRRKLAALQDSVRGPLLERAVVAGALLVVNAAKQDAPYRTGNLRRSIHVGGHGDLSNTTGTQIEAPTVSATRVEVLAGTNVEYARRIEYGFNDTDSLGRTYAQEAQPYLRPAVDENEAAVQREVANALRDLLRAAL